jgi:hypothetical protein
MGSDGHSWDVEPLAAPGPLRVDLASARLLAPLPPGMSRQLRCVGCRAGRGGPRARARRRAARETFGAAPPPGGPPPARRPWPCAGDEECSHPGGRGRELRPHVARPEHDRGLGHALRDEPGGRKVAEVVAPVDPARLVQAAQGAELCRVAWSGVDAAPRIDQLLHDQVSRRRAGRPEREIGLAPGQVGVGDAGVEGQPEVGVKLRRWGSAGAPGIQRRPAERSASPRPRAAPLAPGRPAPGRPRPAPSPRRAARVPRLLRWGERRPASGRTDGPPGPPRAHRGGATPRKERRP